MKSRLFIVPVFLFLTISAYADSENQTDWAGGPGEQGPVTEWGNSFNSAVSTCWLCFPGMLSLSDTSVPPIEHLIDGNFSGARDACANDIDGDGDIDVAGAARVAGNIVWWENSNGTGTDWIEHTINNSFAGASGIEIYDINGDGYSDVVASAFTAGDIKWWENDDGSGIGWTMRTIDASFSGASSVCVADINGDGYPDVLGTAFNSNSMKWWENTDGTGTSWTERTVSSDFAGARSTFAADIDGDGDLDVTGAAETADDITWWENVNGSGTSWSVHAIQTDFDGARAVYSADIDGDGDMDVLGASWVEDTITWWENLNGSGTNWDRHDVDTSYWTAYDVCAADINGDGKMDILGAAHFDAQITWWKNLNGSGTEWAEHTVDDNFDEASSVIAADINGDAALDILGTALEDNDVAWWEVTEFKTSGQLESAILYLGADPLWNLINWTATTPPGTTILFQLRASDDYTNMGSWSTDITTSGTSLSGILTDYDSYLQYKVILQTTNTDVSPILEDVTITWDGTGVAGSQALPSGICLGQAVPNPCNGTTTLSFSVSACCHVQLRIFDINGRLAYIPADKQYEAGSHSIKLTGLPPGLYLCQMNAAGCTSTCRLTIID